MKREDKLWMLVFAAVLTLPLTVFYHYPPTGSVFGDSSALFLWGVLALFVVSRGSMTAVGENSTPLTSAFSDKRPRFSNYLGNISPARGSSLIACACIFWWLLQVAAGNYGFLSVALTLLAIVVAGVLAFKLGTQYSAMKLPLGEGGKYDVFAGALMWMGVIVGGIGWLQYLYPNEFGPWISPLVEAGRIYGNIRQPNHLALILAWAIWGIIWWAGSNPRRYHVGVCALFFVVPVLAFTGSRMGQLLIVALVALSWASPNRKARIALAVGATCVYVCAWFGAALASKYLGIVFFGASRSIVSTGGRFELWSQTISILPQLPWYGCGPGQFNFCWTHAILDTRVEGAVANAHNLLLNSLVEWGWPLTLVIFGWITVGMVAFFRRGIGTSAALPAGIFFASLIHSMLEYPWWYTYLFLPTAFSFGWMWAMCAKPLGSPVTPHDQIRLYPGISQSNPPQPDQKLRRKLSKFLPGVVLICFGLTYAAQYWPLRVLFAAGYAKQLSTDDLRKVNTDAALFSMPLSYAMAMRLTSQVQPDEARAMLPYLKQAGRGLEDPNFLSRFALVAALAGENAMAKHLAWRAIQLDLDQSRQLANVVAQINHPSLSTFKSYLLNPYPVNLERSVFTN